ncbi:MAG: sulfatase-like hydrolase/transferase [Planctomycetota bacterium]
MLLPLLLAALPQSAETQSAETQSAGAPSEPVPPNVVIVLLDDVGRDRIGAYGDHPSPAPTPHIDGLAKRGVLFRNAWAYPSCSPTRAALLTGRHAERTGMGAVILTNDGVQTPLDPEEVILPEALPRHGSIVIGKWHLRDSEGPLAHPNEVGFDRSIVYVGPNTFESWTRVVDGESTPRTGYFPRTVAEDAVAAFGEMEEPFFAYVCPKLAHSPYHVPPAELHTRTEPTTREEKHVAMTEAVDTLLGRMLDAIDLSDTYVFVIGDNGSPGPTVSGPFERGRVKGSVYEGGVRVPFLVAGPGVARGIETDELVHVTDVFATVLDLARAPAPKRGAEDSVSFAPLLRAEDARGARETLYVSSFPHEGTVGESVRAIRTKRYKLIHSVTFGTFELYDLEKDPLEQVDLIKARPGPDTDALRERLLALVPEFE